MERFAGRCPFAPGPGTIPERIVGREDEWHDIAGALDDIVGPRVAKGKELVERPTPPIKISGPRGVGKTLLLGLAGQEAAKRGVDVVRAAHMEDVGDYSAMTALLRDVFEGQCFWERWARAGAGYGSGGGGRESMALLCREALAAKIRKTPTVLLLDEVQNYDGRHLYAIIRAVQCLIEERQPLAMILAGTPDLDSHLKKHGLEHELRCLECTINELEHEEVVDALRTPFARRGVAVKEDALELMASEAEGYPYFVQLIGEAAWELAKEGRRREIDRWLAEEAVRFFRESRTGFYLKLYDELEGEDLLPYANQAIRIISSQKQGRVAREVMSEGIAARNQGMATQVARGIVDRMRELGVIWQGECGRLRFNQPSFADFIKRKERVFQEQLRELNAASPSCKKG